MTLSEEMDRLNHEFELIDDFYIADGHHRSASVSKFNEVSHHYFNDKMMCFVIQEDQLSILPFHRLVNSIYLDDKVSILSKLSEEFDVKKSTESIYIVNNEGTFGIYLDKAMSNPMAVKQLEKIPEVLECHYTTGNWSILIKIFCKDNEHLMHVLNKEVQQIEGVSRTETFISLAQQIDRQITI